MFVSNVRQDKASKWRMSWQLPVLENKHKLIFYTKVICDYASVLVPLKEIMDIADR